MNAEMKKLIQQYRLQPHPEGGYYREVYSSAVHVESTIVSARRPAMTHIYFLLGHGEHSRFHRVRHDELWHFYTGAELCLYTFDGAKVESRLLGPNTVPTEVVPGGRFQAAETTGDYTLAGCTVAPGFNFADFNFLADIPDVLATLKQQGADYLRLV